MSEKLSATEVSLIAAGVRNLREFGYPNCTSENILTDRVYSQFFASMLDGNRGHGKSIDSAIASLQQRIALSAPERKV